jgi:hypothetical protein
MKKIMTILSAFLFCALTLSSCKSVQVAKFTSVENLYQIKLGSTIEEVISLVGSKPYNILSTQIDGYTIYTYKYKFVERKVNPKIINSRGGETTGTEVYNGKEQTAFMFFKGGKLESFVTTEGCFAHLRVPTLPDILPNVGTTEVEDKRLTLLTKRIEEKRDEEKRL